MLHHPRAADPDSAIPCPTAPRIDATSSRPRGRGPGRRFRGRRGAARCERGLSDSRSRAAAPSPGIGIGPGGWRRWPRSWQSPGGPSGQPRSPRHFRASRILGALRLSRVPRGCGGAAPGGARSRGEPGRPCPAVTLGTMRTEAAEDTEGCRRMPGGEKGMPERTEDAGTARGCGDGAAGAVPQCGAAAAGTAAPLTCEAAGAGAQEAGAGGEQEPEEAAGAHGERPERPRRRRSRCCSRSVERGRRLRPGGGGETGPGRAGSGAEPRPSPAAPSGDAPPGSPISPLSISPLSISPLLGTANCRAAPGHGSGLGYGGRVSPCGSSPGFPRRFLCSSRSSLPPSLPVPVPEQGGSERCPQPPRSSCGGGL